MSVYSELADSLDCVPLKTPKPTDIELLKDFSKRNTPQVSTPQGNNSHDKLVSSHFYDLPAIDPMISQLKPWKTDSKYFNKCMISSLALMKMTTHAQSGGSIEIMGMLIGKIVDRSIVVMDTYRLPVEGTETRVNAQGEAYEYMVQYLELIQKIKNGSKPRQENIVGWYHSHPGYGCWLSGIDVSTQELNQNFQDPYLAIVVDPVKTLKLGKVDIGAFRTLPVAFTEGGGNNYGASRAALLNSPKSKRQEFGSHASRYYSLDVEIFENEKDGDMLKLLQKQDAVDYDGWMKKLAVDEAESVRAHYEDSSLPSLEYLDNFEFVEDNETGTLKEVIKKLESLKSSSGENPASLFLKKIIGASKSDVVLQSRGISRRRQVEYEEEDVLDESDLEKVDTGEEKLGGETEGEDWDEDEDDESCNEQDAKEMEHDDGEEQANNLKSKELQEQMSEEDSKPKTETKESKDLTTEQPSSTNAPLPLIKRSMRKQLRSRKDDLSDLLYDPSLAGVHHKLKRKQRPLPRQLALARYPDEYLRQIEFLDLHRRQQRWTRERMPGEHARYPMPSSMALDLREKNKLVIEASRAVASKNVCDLITMEAKGKVKRGSCE